MGIEDRLRRIEGDPNCGSCPYNEPVARSTSTRIIDADGRELGYIKNPNDPGDALPELCSQCPHADLPVDKRPVLAVEVVRTVRYDELGVPGGHGRPAELESEEPLPVDNVATESAFSPVPEPEGSGLPESNALPPWRTMTEEQLREWETRQERAAQRSRTRAEPTLEERELFGL